MAKTITKSVSNCGYFLGTFWLFVRIKSMKVSFVVDLKLGCAFTRLVRYVWQKSSMFVVGINHYQSKDQYLNHQLLQPYCIC